jgi:hypothetical protein
MNNNQIQEEVKHVTIESKHHLDVLGGVLRRLQGKVNEKINFSLITDPQVIPNFASGYEDVAVFMVKMEVEINEFMQTEEEKKESKLYKEELSQRMVYIGALDKNNRYTIVFKRPLPHYVKLFETDRSYRYSDALCLQNAITAVYNFLLHGSIPM